MVLTVLIKLVHLFLVYVLLIPRDYGFSTHPSIHLSTFRILSRHLSGSQVPGAVLGAADLKMCESHSPSLQGLGLDAHIPGKPVPGET